MGVKLAKWPKDAMESWGVWFMFGLFAGILVSGFVAQLAPPKPVSLFPFVPPPLAPANAYTLDPTCTKVHASRHLLILIACTSMCTYTHLNHTVATLPAGVGGGLGPAPQWRAVRSIAASHHCRCCDDVHVL